jgi:hypothetical protein
MLSAIKEFAEMKGNEMATEETKPYIVAIWARTFKSDEMAPYAIRIYSIKAINKEEAVGAAVLNFQEQEMAQEKLYCIGRAKVFSVDEMTYYERTDRKAAQATESSE